MLWTVTKQELKGDQLQLGQDMMGPTNGSLVLLDCNGVFSFYVFILIGNTIAFCCFFKILHEGELVQKYTYKREARRDRGETE